MSQPTTVLSPQMAKLLKNIATKKPQQPIYNLSVPEAQIPKNTSFTTQQSTQSQQIQEQKDLQLQLLEQQNLLHLQKIHQLEQSLAGEQPSQQQFNLSLSLTDRDQNLMIKSPVNHHLSEALDSEIKSLKKQLNESKLKIQSLSAENTNMKQQLEQVQPIVLKYRQISQEHAQLKRQVGQQVEVDENLQDIQQVEKIQMQRLITENQSIQKQLNDALFQIKSQDGKLREKDDLIARQKVQIENIYNEKVALKMQESEDKIAKIQQEHYSEKMQLEDQINKVQIKIDDLQQKHTSLLQEYEQLKQENVQLVKNYEFAQEQLKSKQNEVNQQALIELQKQKAESRHEQDRIKLVEEHAAELDKLNKQVNSATLLAEQKQIQVEHLQVQFDSAKKDLEIMKHKLQEADKEKNSLLEQNQNELSKKQEQIDAKEHMIEKLMKDKELLNKVKEQQEMEAKDEKDPIKQEYKKKEEERKQMEVKKRSEKVLKIDQMKQKMIALNELIKQSKNMQNFEEKIDKNVQETVNSLLSQQSKQNTQINDLLKQNIEYKLNIQLFSEIVMRVTNENEKKELAERMVKSLDGRQKEGEEKKVVMQPEVQQEKVVEKQE